MNKYIKQLVESFFDDIEDENIFDTDSQLTDMNVSNAVIYGNLEDCSTEDEIIAWLDNYIETSDYNDKRQAILLKTKANLILKEIQYIPTKQYSISLKDMDRMRVCRETGRYNGFRAITKIDKLIPRFAAGVVVWYDPYNKHPGNIIQFTPLMLYNFIFKYGVFNTLFSYVRDKSLRELIRLKDIVNACNSYNP